MKVRWPWQVGASDEDAVPVDETLRRAETLADKLTGLVTELEKHLEGSASDG